MVKADWRPWKALLNVALVALVLAVGGWLATGISFWETLLGSCLFVLFFRGHPMIREFRRLRRAEQRRQAAVSGAQSYPLASPQPYPDPEALPLPFVISKRPASLAFLYMPILIWLGVVAVSYIFFWSSLWPKHGPLIHTLALSLVFTLPISFVVLASEYRWIEVDVEGLTIRTLFWSKSIAWPDVRLFAVDAALEVKKTSDHYELSSATTILRWSREQNPSGLTKASNLEEYTWQMKALHSVIAARTGLPLYDLRDGVATNVAQAVPYPLTPPSIPAQP